MKMPTPRASRAAGLAAVADPIEEPGALAAAVDPVSRDVRTVAGGLWRAVAWSALAGLPVLCLFLDVQWLSNAVGEWSAVEFAQLGVLACVVAAHAGLARRSPAERPFAVLAAGFFACMLVRETDALWDLVQDGLWQVLVSAVAVASLAYAARDWRSTLAGLARLLASRAGLVLTMGLVLVLVYSRLIGMGALWQGLLDEQYLRVFKNAVEEVTELLGYLVVLAASATHARRRLPTATGRLA